MPYLAIAGKCYVTGTPCYVIITHYELSVLYYTYIKSTKNSRTCPIIHITEQTIYLIKMLSGKSLKPCRSGLFEEANQLNIEDGVVLHFNGINDNAYKTTHIPLIP